MLHHFALFTLALALPFACSDADGGVCGDGVVDPDEACDAAGEGCDAACHLTGATAWTVTRIDPDWYTNILDIAVGPSGRIAVLGVTHDTSSPYGTAWALALAPDGSELWRTEFAGLDLDSLFPPHIAVDADDGVLVQSTDLRRLDRDGQTAWKIDPEDSGYTAMTASAGVVYLAGFCTVDLAADEYTACTSRIDPSGDSVWEWRADDSINYWPMALAVAGDSLVTLVSRFESMKKDGESQILRFDLESGAPGPVTDLESLPEPNLFAGLRGGDVVLTSEVDDKGVVHRIGPDGEVRWTVPAEFNRFTGILDLAAGPDDSVVLVGDTRDEPRANPVMTGIARALDGDGVLAWDLDLPPESPWGLVSIHAAAHGPGFLVIAGDTSDGFDNRGTWISRIGPP